MSRPFSMSSKTYKAAGNILLHFECHPVLVITYEFVVNTANDEPPEGTEHGKEMYWSPGPPRRPHDLITKPF